MINVLFITLAYKNFDGATYSLMDLIKSVQDHVHPIVLLKSKGCVYDYFRNNNVECITYNFEENLVGIPRKPHQVIKFIIKYIPRIIKYKTINQKCIHYLETVIKEKNIDLIHTNNSVLDIGYLISKKTNIKQVWHLRGFMDLDFGWMPLIGWKKYKKEISNSDAVIGITQSVLNHYISKPKNNHYVIFDAVRNLNDICYIKNKEKYFLFCAGILSKQKGTDFAIKAFAKSGLHTRGYRLRIIGDACPKYHKELLDLANSLNINDKIDLIGRTNDVKSHMMNATAFLMCSDNEGLGRVSIEAMFYGCLVIGKNSGGTKEFIINGETGYLFNDINECVTAMLAAINDSENIILNAQKFAQKHFAIENYGSKIMNVYNYLIHNE